MENQHDSEKRLDGVSKYPTREEEAYVVFLFEYVVETKDSPFTCEEKIKLYKARLDVHLIESVLGDDSEAAIAAIENLKALLYSHLGLSQEYINKLQKYREDRRKPISERCYV